MRRTVLALAAALVSLIWVATSYATIEMQKKAKAAGVDAPNCMACHTEKLPKKGTPSLNDKGKWLVAEKDKRKAKEVDPTWLKEYVEKK
jgi:hypothetical protein